MYINFKKIVLFFSNKIMEVTNLLSEQNSNLQNINPLQLKKSQLETRNLELKEENKRLNIKLEELKKNVLELKQHVDSVIYNQLELKSSKIKDLKLQIDISKNKIYELNKQLDNYDTIYNTQKTIRQKYFNLINDKLKNENFYLTQEDIIKELRDNNIKLKEKRMRINDEFTKADEEYTNLYNNVEINKKTILELQNDLQSKIDKNKESINTLNEKTIEISNLRNTLNLLKAENEQSFLYKQKNKKNLKKNDSNININTTQNKILNINTSFNNVNNNDISTSFMIKQHQLNQQKLYEGLNNNSITNIIDQSNLNENEQNNINEVAALAHNFLEE